jgi:hypothetical protein
MSKKENIIIKIALLKIILDNYDNYINKKIFINEFDFKIFLKQNFKYLFFTNFQESNLTIYIKSNLIGDININYFNDSITHYIEFIPFFESNNPIVIYYNDKMSNNIENKKQLDYMIVKRIYSHWDKKEWRLINLKYRDYLNNIKKIHNDALLYDNILSNFNKLNNIDENKTTIFVNELIEQIKNFNNKLTIKNFIEASELNKNGKEFLIKNLEYIIEIIIVNDNINDNINIKHFILHYLTKELININDLNSCKYTKDFYEKQFKIIDKVNRLDI